MDVPVAKESWKQCTRSFLNSVEVETSTVMIVYLQNGFILFGIFLAFHFLHMLFLRLVEMSYLEQS